MCKHMVAGNTYPVREKMRELGGKWDGQAKAWGFDDEATAAAAREIVAQAGPVVAASRGASRARGGGRYRSDYTRFSGGGEMYVNKRGRCEDAPCCGCCS